MAKAQGKKMQWWGPGVGERAEEALLFKGGGVSLWEDEERSEAGR